VFDTIKSVFVPIHRDGHKFIAIFALLTLIAFWVAEPLGWIGVVATAWCAYFFRDPYRVTPLREGLVVSPADGRICAIEDVVPPPELDLERVPCVRISVFMNVFDVHVNRAPSAGTVARVTYVPGRFINAELDKASLDNERLALTMELPRKKRIGVVQIAGLVARRIVPFAKEGDVLAAGERFGLIRFGSRVDVYLPAGHNAHCAIGQRAVAGETVMADLKSKEAERAARRG
jgi:phosphatidylserine decarboxylase